MIQQRKKIIAVLIAVALFGSALLSNSTEQVKVIGSSIPGKSSVDKIDSAPVNKTGNSELFFKMMFIILLVAGLGIAAIYISKKVVPKLANSGGKRIQLLESAHLGPRKTVYLIKIDNRLLLIGSTSDNMIKLCDINVSDSALETEVAN